MKRALCNSAQALPSVCHFAQGHGLLQMEGAFDHLLKHGNDMERDVRFDVKCQNNSKGIHFRGRASEKEQEMPVKVKY